MKRDKKATANVLTLTAENIDDVYETVTRKLIKARHRVKNLESVKKQCVAMIEKMAMTERWHFAGYLEMTCLRKQKDIIVLLEKHDLIRAEFVTNYKIPIIKRNSDAEGEA